MKESNDPINQILQNTAKTAERTRNIERNLEELQLRYVEESASRDERISDLERKTERQDTILAGALVAAGATLTALYNWLVGLL